jgi:F-type H+-transporting ATPase subunit delta
VETSGGIQASLSGRYALALFELARDDKQLDAVSASLANLKQALAESADFKALTTSPLVKREQASRTIAALTDALQVDALTARFLGVLAKNGRLFQLGTIIRDFSTLAARHRGEITAEVTSAHALDDDQVQALKTKLKSRFGRDVAVDLKVDKAILGGLIVKAGSTRIDGSIRTKLNTLANAMKG